ncbi:MAG TPA: divergent polysaccharide deacetylase family protein [Terriglobia bacterium]|nr:divergent polysaccharide deacetylase family protein [Terriglobia bacterium]
MSGDPLSRHRRFPLISPRQNHGSGSWCKPAAALRAFLSPTSFNISFFFLIFLALFSSDCSRKKTVQKQVKEFDRRAIALRVLKAIEHAGGSDVWVKAGTQSSLSSSLANRGSAPPEVLADSSHFDAVVRAIRAQGEVEGLKTAIHMKDSNERLRSAEIRLLRQNELVIHWRVREVSKLLRAAIVIDDMGGDLNAAHQLLRQPYPLTFSILPDLPHSAETARQAHAAGRAVMLHLPMEPEPGSGARTGQGGITVGMQGDAVARIIHSDLTSVPFAEGVNNHMGSRATADAALMREVMRILAARGLYFVDSRTTAETNALNVARRMGLAAFYRSVFLDDTESVAYTLQQLRTFRQVIEVQGVALAIGHPHPTTIEALAKFLPEFERDDIQLIPVSQLVHLPEAARLQPPRNPKVAPGH